MSSSFVPKIAMSKGTAKDNKFDVSVNCHTTSEVGYLQPTFSKILMPNSDLKIKSSSSVLLSSLVCPTFGDLFLRSWYMATPVSSLWACLGAFLSQRSFNDLDNPSGHSIPSQMPKASMSSVIRNLVWSQYYQHQKGFVNNSIADMPLDSRLAGNLTYPYKIDGTHASNDILSYDEFCDIIMLYPSETGYARVPMSCISRMSTHSYFPVDLNNEQDVYQLKYVRDDVSDPDGHLRFSTIFPWWWNGIVVKNTTNLVRMFTSSSGVTSFPSPDDCPYVVLFIRNLGFNWFRPSEYEDASSITDVSSGGLYVVPLTLRMFQGDSDKSLYDGGWRNYVRKHGDKLYHSSGRSLGWSLSPDDAYFTGDIPHPNKMDSAGYQLSENGVELSFYWAVRFSRRFKRIRKVFVGLGTQFNPFDKDPQTFWKIFSYYKAWFDNFYPKRDIQYYQTPLARIVNYFSYHSRVFNDYALDSLVGGVSSSGFPSEIESVYFDIMDLIYAIGDAKYLMPLDYFTLADKEPLENDKTSDAVMDVITGTSTDTTGVVNASSGSLIGPEYHSETLNGWAIKMADKMLSYLTKKRVVGKSVSESMRAIFGAVDDHDKSHESTWCFGTHSTPIQISAVMSQAETEDMHLGDYAGRGIGGDETKFFDVSVKSDLLVVLVMSAIVPRLGYYQGTLKENRIGSSPNDFCKPLWDAVGYDDVDVTEYIADVVHKTDVRNPQVVPEVRGMETFNGHILGLVPRYTWYKTSRDIVNGDMSIPSLKDSLNPYVLTRDVDRGFSTDPLAMRTISPDTFNKIFNESSSLDDHFIIQIGHKADLYAPLKSITTSFDDFDESEEGTIEVEHS